MPKGVTHGMSYTKTYYSWQGMRSRCTNPKTAGYRQYGGRGITYDKRWDKFENFLEDMGGAPDGFTLDRIDVNGNYCKENCRWTDMQTQQNNRRNNVFFNGKSLAEWSKEIGVPKSTLANRIYVLNWPMDKVFSTPLLTKGGKVKNEDELKAALG